MNKKGFTLIELLAAVVIMIVLSSIVVLSFSKLKENRDEKKIAEFERELSNAACTYVDLSRNNYSSNPCYNDTCAIKVQDLIADGLISKDLKDPRNDNDPVDPDTIVDVTWDDGEKTCTVRGY